MYKGRDRLLKIQYCFKDKTEVRSSMLKIESAYFGKKQAADMVLLPQIEKMEGSLAYGYKEQNAE